MDYRKLAEVGKRVDSLLNEFIDYNNYSIEITHTTYNGSDRYKWSICNLDHTEIEGKNSNSSWYPEKDYCIQKAKEFIDNGVSKNTSNISGGSGDSLKKLESFINSMKHVHYIPDDERKSILADLNEIYEGFKNQNNTK